MTNWLEEEENKKSNLAQRNNLLLNSLNRFYDICRRVNKVKSGVSISEFEVIGNTKRILSERIYFYGGDHTDELYFKRGIRFSIWEQDEMILEVITRQYTYRQYIHTDDAPGNIVVHIRKKLFPKELNEWNEEKMLNLIQWLLFEIDSVRETLPGEEMEIESSSIKSSLESELSRLKKDLVLENHKLAEIEVWKFDRRREVREEQILKQKSKIDPLIRRINEITFELSERFMKI
jgi:hypothetical protein